ncbi:MAG: 2,3-bisphosphoglycerate-independent phosphoglycerate mutase [Proteobacteria bacterium]|nr:2,3-bisphosphoglycerate-independent phosphoglycerate mutase [Pseudomonadota bacterium]
MLEPLKVMDVPRPKGPVFIIVLDGVGEGRKDESDAVFLARTPTFDMLDKVAQKTFLYAHGTHVGMPTDDDMGNSEVGHNAIGAGRIFAQGASLVENAVKSGRIFESKTWHWLLEPALREDKKLHFIGLLSDGNVHSHIDHLIAMIRRADEEGVAEVCVHPLLDGRDVGATTALVYIGKLEQALAEINAREGRDYRIASGGGRMVTTMDRYEADWRIVERGWHAHVLGDARAFSSASEAIETFRAENQSIDDQNLPAFTVVRNGKPAGTIEDGDTVILFNFRGDRAIEISHAFEADAFDKFDRIRHPNVRYAGMMQYDGDTNTPAHYLVTPPTIDKTLGEYLCATGLKQLAVAETQKFGHVTYFWNGNRSGYFDASREKYIEVESDRVDFSQRPWMKCAEVTDAIIAEVEASHYDVVRVNYANGDMVGHTGNREATIIAIEAVNLALGRLLEKVRSLGGVAIITADHGNADEMYQYDKKKGDFARDSEGQPVPLTSHTLNRVPFWYYDPSRKLPWKLDLTLDVRRLSNIAATVISLLGYQPPSIYDPSLIRRTDG